MKPKVQYILTWVSLGVMLIAGLGLMAASWNGVVKGSVSPSVMVLFWICMSTSGIYLFMLAVKKAHRAWIQDEKEQKEANKEDQQRGTSPKSSREQQSLDFAATARKLVRRIPEDTNLEESGKLMMKNLARELEIMSGLFYIRKGSTFVTTANYALASPDEPFAFKEGEGMSGQVARNQQVMVLTRLPEDHLKVCSGLGKSEPKYLAIVPFIHRHKTIALLECSGYRHDPGEIESMFRIFSRDLMEKMAPNLK